jgi:hypothetical protein
MIIIALWGLWYFKHIAAKNFYPVGNFYFQRLAIGLMFGFLVMFSAPMSFNAGTHLKARNLFDQKTFAALYDNYFMAIPFLVENKSNYHFENRSYDSFHKRLIYISLKDYQESNSDKDRLAANLPKTVNVINGSPYYIYTQRYDSTFTIVNKGKDTCWDFNAYYDKFYNLNEIPDFKEKPHIKNFKYDEDYDMYATYDSRNVDDLINEDHNKNDLYLARIHYFVDYSPDSVLLTLQNFKKNLSKLNIKNNEFYPEKTYQLLKEKNFWVTQTLTMSPNGSAIDEAAQAMSVDETDDTKVNEENPNNLTEIDGQKDVVNTLDYSSITTLFSNLDKAHQMSVYNFADLGTFYLPFALAFVALIVLFELVNFKDVALSIPVGGAIFFVMMLMVILMNIFTSASIFIGLFFMILIILGMIYSLYFKHTSRRSMNIIYVLAYVVSPLFLIVLSFGLKEVLNEEVYNFCTKETELVSTYSEVIHTAILYVSPYVLYLIFLFTSKDFLAKEE